MPVKIFFSYAHEDEPLLNQLKAHLKPLQREGLIDVWHDRDISAGTEWEQEISRQLSEADVILLLISPGFINSDYCYGKEMKRAMERHERGEARVIPIILRPVADWQKAPFGRLQALPTGGKPITDPDWYNLDRALFNVTEGIRKAIGKPPPPPIVQSQPFDLSIAPKRANLNFFRKPVRSSWFIAALTLLIIISVTIGFVSFRLLPSPTSPSPTPSPNATSLTPQEVQSWCSPIPHSSGTCNLSRFEQSVEPGGHVNPNAVHMKPGDPVSFNVPAGISVNVWDCSKQSRVSGPIKLSTVCEADFYSIFTQVWRFAL